MGSPWVTFINILTLGVLALMDLPWVTFSNVLTHCFPLLGDFFYALTHGWLALHESTLDDFI